MALIYVVAGLNHFRSPKLYERIIPPYFPNPTLNLISGFAEVVLGIALLIPVIKPCRLGIIALLIAVFPTHIYIPK
jgi:uncharacterized membrane protein